MLACVAGAKRGGGGGREKGKKQNFTKNAKTITAQKTKFEKPQRSKAKPKLLETANPTTQLKGAFRPL